MSRKSILYPTEPNWFKNRSGIHHKIPDAAASWLFEPESITRRLRCRYGNQVKVQVLYHQHRSPFLSESRLLKEPSGRYCLTREVMLTTYNRPLILARTIIPEKTLIGAQRILSRLGTRPLGEVIFSYPKLERQEMQSAYIQPSTWFSTMANNIELTQGIWGRRTVYSINQRHMLVSEFFLPEIIEKADL